MKKIRAFITAKIEKFVLNYYHRMVDENPDRQIDYMSGKFKDRVEKDKQFAGKNFNFIKKMFIGLIQKDLVLNIREVPVKKGRIRYTLVIVATPKGELVYNLGRFPQDIIEGKSIAI